MHAAARVVRCRRDQGRATGRRRCDARSASRHPGCGQPLFHDAESQQTQHHPQYQGRAGQRNLHPAHRAMRRDGGELCPRSARSHGIYLGAHPGDQSAHDLRLGQGLRPRPLPGLQGVRERRPVHRRLGEHHRVRRRPTAGDRRSDRRLRNRVEPGAGHRDGVVPQGEIRTRSARHLRDAGRCPEPLPREAARSAASRPRTSEGVSAVPERRVRRGHAAGRKRLRGRSTGLGGQMRAGWPQRLHLRDHSAAGMGSR